MQYQSGAAIGGWCTERTASRSCRALRHGRALLAAIAAVVGAGAACSESDRAERGQSQAPAVGDTRTAGTAALTAGAHATAKPICPATGAWQVCSVVERLERAGLAPQRRSGDVVEAPLASPGVAIVLGRSELRIFVYADRAAREHDQAKLDTSKYASASEPLSMRAEPTLITSENLLAILRSRNDHQRERVSDAITAGPPQSPGTKG
jgi:hypothetical protein